jgi:hypothetical protein
MFSVLYPEAHFLTYGLGWFLSDFRGKKLVEHGGAIDGMRAEVAMIPEENVGVVILTNMNGTLLPHLIAYRIFDAYMGKPGRDWSGETLKKYQALLKQAAAAQKKAEAERVKGTSPSFGLEQYAGKYQSKMYGEAEIKFEGGKLTAHFGPNFNGELEHWHYDTFQVKWQDPVMGKGLMQFSLNTQGKVAAVNFGGMGEFMRMPEKKKEPEKADGN